MKILSGFSSVTRGPTPMARAYRHSVTGITPILPVREMVQGTRCGSESFRLSWLQESVKAKETVPQQKEEAICEVRILVDSRISAACHSVMSICSLKGYSVLEYLKRFFAEITIGNRDYGKLMPSIIGISANKI